MPQASKKLTFSWPMILAEQNCANWILGQIILSWLWGPWPLLKEAHVGLCREDCDAESPALTWKRWSKRFHFAWEKVPGAGCQVGFGKKDPVLDFAEKIVMQRAQPWLGKDGCKRFHFAWEKVPGGGCQDGFGRKDPGAGDLGRGESRLKRPKILAWKRHWVFFVRSNVWHVPLVENLFETKTVFPNSAEEKSQLKKWRETKLALARDLWQVWEHEKQLICTKCDNNVYKKFQHLLQQLWQTCNKLYINNLHFSDYWQQRINRHRNKVEKAI